MSGMWALEINGTKKSLGAWGVISGKLTLGSLINDQLVFTARADLKIAFETPVVLWLDNQRRFSGVVTLAQFAGSTRGDRRQFTVSGPWWYLENIIYQQPRWVLVDAFDPTKGYTTGSTSMLVLFQGDDGKSIYAGAQAKAAIDYAIAKGAPIARTTTFDLDAVVPWEKGFDLSCAEIIRHCARWTRDVVSWWDYSTAVPVLHIGRRANLIPVELDLNAGNTVVELTPQPRYDLQPRGVLIWFVKTEVDDAGRQWLNLLSQGAGVVDGGVGVIVITFRLAGIGTSSEPIPEGLAQAFYNSVKDLQWQGSIVVNLVGVSGSMGPGNTIHLMNGDAEWSTMAAPVQSIEENLFTGETRINFGPPSHLSIQDFTQLIAVQRGLTSTGGVRDSGSSRFDGTPDTPPNIPIIPKGPNGGPPPTPPGEGPSGAPKPGQSGIVMFYACDDGEKRLVIANGWVPEK